MAIKVVISLEGVEEVKKGITDVQKAGETMSKSLSGLKSADVGVALSQLGLTSGQAAKGVDTLALSVGNLRQAKILLRPILGAVGLGVGELGQFAKVASLGMGALAVAAGAAAVTGLAKLQIAAATTKQKLDDIGKSRGTSQAGEFFKNVNTAAEQLGVTVQDLQPPIQALFKALDAARASSTVKFVGEIIPKGAVGDAKNAIDLFQTLFKVLTEGGATTDEAKQALSAFFDSVAKSGGKITADAIRTLEQFPGAINFLVQAFGKGETNAEKFFATLKLSGGIDFTKFQEKILATKDAVDKGFDPTKVNSLGDAVNKALADIDKGLLNLSGNSLSDLVIGSILNFGIGLKTILDGIAKVKEARQSDINVAAPENQAIQGPAIIAGINALSEAFSKFFKDDLPALALGGFDQVAAVFGQPIDLTAFASSFQSIWDTIVQAAQNAWQRINQIFQQQINLNINGSVGDPSGIPFASGGQVRGPGTGTSDSILAWLSNGEYVLRQRAVQFYGADFIQALNQLKLPKDFFRGFSVGGLVAMPQMPIPRFAEGGHVTSSKTPITLVLGGSKFNMTASDDTVKQLQTVAISNRVKSGGRKPNWFVG